MTGNTFTKLDAGKSTPTFDLKAGSYVVSGAAVPTAPGQHAGVVSLEMEQPSGAFSAFGALTDFRQRNSATVKLPVGTYRFTAIRTGATFASVTPAS
jgi:hypothetical protein